MNVSGSTVEELHRQKLDLDWVLDVVERALDEDLMGDVDVTSVATIPEDQVDTADVVARAPGVVAGMMVAVVVLETVLDNPEIELRVSDGDRVERGDVLLTVTGKTRGLLTAERTMLNLLCRASGVATATRAWVDVLEGFKTGVLDTRKTTPGLRLLEKYAVRCGGGTNKRMGLSDVAMIKDNHVLAAGGVVQAFELVQEEWHGLEIQVEVTTVEQAVEVVEAGATFLLCDNMTPAALRHVVAAVGGRAEIEATGGLTLDIAVEYAETGVDYLSVGALTHSAPILDIAMDLRPRPTA